MLEKIARRGLLRLFAGAAAAAPAIGQRHPNNTHVPTPWFDEPCDKAPPPSDPIKAAKRLAWETFNGQREQEDAENRSYYRINGFHSDVASMRSWSPAFKAQVQYRRDRQEGERWTKIAKALGITWSW